ncbi:hypothetical protein [Aureimonas sp. AU4]|uniref:hypothetical protein n=1 Tax=Aureimonas sp. AU4 TaxID=1638163 RepID=UPI0007840E18|nr:hypothetical protein [Aureimonas sp. AU4]
MSDTIETLGLKHGFSREAVSVLAEAMRRSGGTQAQFSHPELGGMGQWSQGGMLMIGAMNDHALKARVAALAEDLSKGTVGRQSTSPGSATPPNTSDWPSEFGSPSATGSQNGVRYAVFREERRLAIERDGHLTVYDTQDHVVAGAAQSQGRGTALRLSSQHGDIDIETLPVVHQ